MPGRLTICFFSSTDLILLGASNGRGARPDGTRLEGIRGPGEDGAEGAAKRESAGELADGGMPLVRSDGKARFAREGVLSDGPDVEGCIVGLAGEPNTSGVCAPLRSGSEGRGGTGGTGRPPWEIIPERCDCVREWRILGDRGDATADGVEGPAEGDADWFRMAAMLDCVRECLIFWGRGEAWSTAGLGSGGTGGSSSTFRS